MLCSYAVLATRMVIVLVCAILPLGFLKTQSIPLCNLVNDVNRKNLGQYLHGCLAFKHCMQLYSKVTIVVFKKSVIKNFNFVLVR